VTTDRFNGDPMEKISKAGTIWREETYACQRELKKKFETLSGFDIAPLYTPQDLQGLDYLRDLGFPGEAPYVRGVHPTMYRGRTWTHRQLAGFGPPAGRFRPARGDEQKVQIPARTGCHGHQRRI